MTSFTESSTAEQPTTRERAVDALRQAAHLSDEARLLKTLATDAVEDALHAARRTVKKVRQGALDSRDELTYRVKRQPLAALTVAFAVGALVGLAIGWGRRRHRGQPQPDEG